MKCNLILIGLPTAGKSTLGVVLAKMLGYDYIDTDLLIQKREGCRLEETIRRHNGNRSAAGRQLGVSPRMMNYRLNKLGIVES